jgi:hypothetical protein
MVSEPVTHVSPGVWWRWYAASDAAGSDWRSAYWQNGAHAPSIMAVVCTPACARERERQQLRERYGKASGYRYPLPAGWRCAECGCSVEEAHAKRDAVKLSALTPQAVTCTPSARVLDAPAPLLKSKLALLH